MCSTFVYMSTALTNSQKRDYAEFLYINGNLSQKEIAEKVEVTEKTIGRWKEENKWEQRKISIMTTKKEELSRMYLQLRELNTNIEQREEGCRYPNSKEADTINKITSAIRNLETETSVGEIIGVAEKFLNFLRKEDIEKAKEIAIYFDTFIKNEMK